MHQRSRYDRSGRRARTDRLIQADGARIVLPDYYDTAIALWMSSRLRNRVRPRRGTRRQGTSQVPQARVLMTPTGAEKEGRATSPDLTASSWCARAVASGSRGYALGYPRDQQWCRRPIREYV